MQKKVLFISALGLCVSLCALVFSRTDFSRTERPLPSPLTTHGSKTISQTSQVHGGRQTAAQQTAPSDPNSSVRTDLFAPPAPPPSSPSLTAAAPTQTTPSPPPAPVSPQAPPDPLAGYIYKGLVTIDGQPLALVENMSSKEGRYLRVGEAFVSGTVAQITATTLTVTVNGESHRLAMNDKISLVPLDKSAAQLASTASPESSADDSAQDAVQRLQGAAVLSVSFADVDNTLAPTVLLSGVRANTLSERALWFSLSTSIRFSKSNTVTDSELSDALKE